jgi:hypothetical protein
LSALPLAAGSEAPPGGRERAWAAVLAAGAAALVAGVVITYPAAGGLPFDLRPLLAFDAARVPAFLRSLAVLLALNLAAWAAGGLLQRLLGAAGGWSVLDAARRLALGFLVLADLVLLLAALHLLQRTLLLVVLLWLAAAGLVVLLWQWRLSRPRVSLHRRPLALLAGGVALLVAVVAVLGAHMPDYGWDAFTYHLALPERYLFENRIVVSPLFPHSAMPLTVEMLYTLLLAVDPGPAAKLLHAELGGLAAAVAAALAARHSWRAGALAVVVLFADPLFNWELGVAYSDLAATLFALLAFAALQERLAGGGGAALRLCGIFAGACVATRYTAAAIPLAVVGVLWLARAPLRQKLRDTAVIAVLAVLVLSPWLLRNLALTGNPVAPALQGLFYARGQEYFDAVAVEQAVAFVRRIGFGRGPEDLLALPVNLTLRARNGDYRAFGFRIGLLYVAGVAAALALAHARRSPALRGLLPGLGLLTLLWFFTSQEPRYLMPALALAAVAAGVGLHEMLRVLAAWWPRALAPLAWLLPLIALAHTQWATLARLPWVYGYALGRLSVEGFRSQDAALVVADRLRAALGPHDRLLLVYEPRGFFFAGLHYVFAHDWELMQLVHRAGDPDALAAELRGLGVTHVLVNTGNIARYRTVAVPSYGEGDLDQDLKVLGALLQRRSAPLLAHGGVFVRRMDWAGVGNDGGAGEARRAAGAAGRGGGAGGAFHRPRAADPVRRE